MALPESIEAVAVTVGVRRAATAHARRDLGRVGGAGVEAVGRAVVVSVVIRHAAAAPCGARP